ncbi:phage repressor protein [Tissierella sp. P1]|uniref:helix-turn-helix domain-containing protein n=1 Tax=Tissierella sp. P1 TaxID=1280483 RepID=UPI000B9FF307|nr:helix-turn-helix domain-containing protein [Tissierella sp. P1]OZV12278.1 phage repressor protein [Tissierella sp. P1]
MVNVNKLKGKIVENGLNISELAKKIGLDRSTLYRKLNSDGETFTIKEANLIFRELKLTKVEAMEIFFNYHVA